MRESIKFEDVKQSYWAYKAIQQAYQSKLLSEYPDNKFFPNQNIPRIQVIVSLVNGLGLTTEGEIDLSIFKDKNKIPDYGKDEVGAAIQNRLIANYPDTGKLKPNQAATRAEVAVMVYQVLVLIGQAREINSSYIIG